MRLVMLLRRSICPAILILLLPVIASGSAGQALAGTPAAKYIGADAYSNPTWGQADTSGSQYYIGPLQSEKFFYNNKALPSSDTATTYQYNVPGCGAMSGSSYVYPKSMQCIIVWNTAASSTGADLNNFLESTLNDPHHIIMVFCNEAETHQGPNGCVCYPKNQEEPCGNVTPGSSAAFISQFEVESNYIRTFESNNGASNVQVAEISWADYYTNGPNGCSVNANNNPNNFIVPYQYVDSYLVDIYEGRNGNPISQPEELDQDPAWTNWVGCTQATGIPRGIAEFAINCGEEQKSLDGGAYEEAVAASFSEDDTYLKNNFPNLLVWNLWDYGGCALDNQSGDEPDSVAAWQKIAAGN